MLKDVPPFRPNSFATKFLFNERKTYEEDVQLKKVIHSFISEIASTYLNEYL
jgi:hypothetical protein